MQQMFSSGRRSSRRCCEFLLNLLEEEEEEKSSLFISGERTLFLINWYFYTQQTRRLYEHTTDTRARVHERS